MTVGARLGPYEVLARIGAGGMGEVFRARDTTLNRDVAIKVLPEAFAKDAERMARFQREAQVLAALNHPNIAQVYGMQVSSDTPALVMEFVPGDSPRGPLPVDEAMQIARQIADALEAAHEKGIVHRDLKPANIKVTPEGKVKVLDFGLAKAMNEESDASNSPTMSIAATKAGVILGTAAYMSPEQAKGKSVDARTDIWAYGCVLYELLTGKQAFGGETAMDAMAAIISRDPDWSALPPGSPVELLRACLQKDVSKRLRHIGDSALVVGSSTILQAAHPTILPPEAASKRPLAWIAAAILFALAAGVLAVIHFRETPPEPRVFRYTIALGEKESTEQFAISPNGRMMAVAVQDAAARFTLRVQSLDSLQMQVLPGTDGARFPFWSPDSRNIGFFADGKVKRIAATGGPAQTICEAPNGRGATWNQDGVIVFNPLARAGLSRVPAIGGTPTPITKPPAPTGHRYPWFLPDGQRFLYFAQAGEPSQTGIWLGSLDGAPPRRLLTDLSSAEYAAPSPGSRLGHLLFVREQTLMAQPVDPRTLEFSGEAFPVAEDVNDSLGQQNNGAFSVSSDGIMVFARSRAARSFHTVLYDRSGKPLQTLGGVNNSTGNMLSPDGKELLTIRGSVFPNSDIWKYDLERGTESRLTFETATHSSVVWSPDGKSVAYVSTPASSDRAGIFSKLASGAGKEELLLKGTAYVLTDWSPDGKYILFESSMQTGGELSALPMEGSTPGKPIIISRENFAKGPGQFSPDGRWIAYSSRESRQREVYVVPFTPGGSPGAKFQVSNNGGTAPRWRHDGKELFYLTNDSKLMVVTIQPKPGGGLTAGTPQALFQSRAQFTAGLGITSGYSVTADGQRFLMNEPTAETALVDPPLTVVLNWLAGVKKN